MQVSGRSIAIFAGIVLVIIFALRGYMSWTQEMALAPDASHTISGRR